ncbi:hypothetical protein GCM10025858_04310 [Alicyclobacillus sacchari]|nr:hypothetical protein GCM10025858_04310 [Alicyclobacillus sacchari]
MTITGLVEEETIGGRERSMKRKSMAKSSLENVLTTLHRLYGIRVEDYHIHVNFPGGMPVDGPSAGVAMAVAIYSAVRKQPVLNTIAMTGELSILGSVRPVGGVPAKVMAAVEAGAKVVLVPKANWQETFRQIADVQVVPVERLEDVLKLSLVGALEEDTERFLGDIVANPINKPLPSAQ